MAGHDCKKRKHTSSHKARKSVALDAISKRMKQHKGRPSRAQLAELTAELDGRMADVHASYSTPVPIGHPDIGPKSNDTSSAMRDLTEVLRGL